MGKAVTRTSDGGVQALVSLYRDAGNVYPYGGRWKALHVSAPGDLIGLPVRDKRTDEEAEWHSFTEALKALRRDHGYGPGDVFRVYLRRYEGREGFYEVHANDWPHGALADAS